jgi:hypothetical protein
MAIEIQENSFDEQRSALPENGKHQRRLGSPFHFAGLKDQTLHIRIGGVDAPEVSLVHLWFAYVSLL